MNYHSKLPYASFRSSDAGCAKTATSGPGLIAACPGLPVLKGTTPAQARSATNNAVPIDTVQYFIEYPENIHMFGVSFNTTVCDISLQCELSYRADLPIHIDPH